MRSTGIASAKQYEKIPVDEQVEVLPLLGDIAVGEQGSTLHLQCGCRQSRL